MTTLPVTDAMLIVLVPEVYAVDVISTPPMVTVTELIVYPPSAVSVPLNELPLLTVAAEIEEDTLVKFCVTVYCLWSVPECRKTP